MSNQAIADTTTARFGPAPAGFFITQKSLESVPFLLDQPEVYEQIRALLVAAENELFVPLLEQAKPTDFTQQFEFFANRYFPIRLQTLINLANAIGVEKFKTEYFEQIPRILIALTQNADHWGLKATEVSDSFGEYFTCAQRIISIAPHMALAPPEPLLRLLGSITEIDFGFTALGLIFEGSITPLRWAVVEVFRLTRRSLLVYQDATNSLEAHLASIRPEQAKMDFDAAYHSAVVDIAGYRPEADNPPSSDKRSIFKRYSYIK